MNPRAHRGWLAALALSLLLHGSLAALLIHRSKNSLRLSESRARQGQRHRAETVGAAKGFGPEWVTIILLPRTSISGQASSPQMSERHPTPKAPVHRQPGGMWVPAATHQPVDESGALKSAAAGAVSPPDSPAGAPSATGLAAARSPGGDTGDGRAAVIQADPAGELYQRLQQSARGCYPAAARRFGLRGTGKLAFCLQGRGSFSALRLIEKTGSEILDRAAAECVVPGALPLPSATGCYEVPCGLASRRCRRRHFRVSLRKSPEGSRNSRSL